MNERHTNHDRRLSPNGIPALESDNLPTRATWHNSRANGSFKANVNEGRRKSCSLFGRGLSRAGRECGPVYTRLDCDPWRNGIIKENRNMAARITRRGDGLAYKEIKRLAPGTRSAAVSKDVTTRTMKGIQRKESYCQNNGAYYHWGACFLVHIQSDSGEDYGRHDLCKARTERPTTDTPPAT